MPRIKCHYNDCGFIDDGYCSAAAVEVDPDAGCMTFSPSADAAVEDDWDDEDEEFEEWSEIDSEDDDDDELWDEDEEF